jgi:hypothetical protein
VSQMVQAQVGYIERLESCVCVSIVQQDVERFQMMVRFKTKSSTAARP